MEPARPRLWIRAALTSFALLLALLLMAMGLLLIVAVGNGHYLTAAFAHVHTREIGGGRRLLSRRRVRRCGRLPLRHLKSGRGGV